MLPILAMLTSSFIIDAIELGVIVYVGTGAIIEAADKLISKKAKKEPTKDETEAMKALEEKINHLADNAEEMKAVLANGDFTEVAKIILEGLGGKENVTSVDNCITRLRIEVKDYTAVDEKKIKSAGVAGIIRPSKTSVQVVIGPKVQFVADEVNRLM